MASYGLFGPHIESNTLVLDLFIFLIHNEITKKQATAG